MHSLACHLDRNSPVPLYEQLYQFMKSEISKGTLPYQTKLPSKRKLAAFLQVSLNTVEGAYEQLTAEGYAESRLRKGYYVASLEDLEIKNGRKEPEAQAVAQAAFDWDFHPGRIDTLNFPVKQWRSHVRGVLDEKNRELFQMGDPCGEKCLREEIAAYLYEARGVRCPPDSIVIGAGSEVLLQQLILLLGNEPVYGVEVPGYPVIRKLLENCPNEVVPLDVDAEGLKIDTLAEKNADIVYVTPSHHFPFGSVLPVNRRIHLLNWAAEKDGRYIIEDDYDSEFRYSGKAIPALQSLDRMGNVIYLGSFSKSLMPSMRISYMVLPENLMDIRRERFSFFHSTVSRTDQHALARFMKSGEFGRHLNRMRKIYRRKLDLIIEELRGTEGKVKVIGEKSGLHIVLSVEEGSSESMLEQKAAQAGIKVYPLSEYAGGQPSFPAKLVLGFAGIPESDLKAVFNRLLASWEIKESIQAAE